MHGSPSSVSAVRAKVDAKKNELNQKKAENQGKIDAKKSEAQGRRDGRRAEFDQRRPRIKTRLMPGRQRHNNAKSRIKKKSIRRRLRLGHRKLGWKIEWRIEGPD